MKTIVVSMLLVCWTGLSHAGASGGQNCQWNPRLQRSVCVHRAPEIDMTSVAAGFTLCLGGLAVLRGRRAKDTPSV